MTSSQFASPTSSNPLRVWPGVVAVAVLWLSRFVAPELLPDIGVYILMIGSALGILGFVVWWLFFSHAPKLVRWGTLGGMIIALIATRPFLHQSIATGMMGVMFFLYAIPVVCLAVVLWAAASRWLSPALRTAALVAAIVAACGAFTLVRTDGITGDGASQFRWRWTATAEERLLAQADEPALPPPTATAAETPAVTATPSPSPTAQAEATPATTEATPAASPSPLPVEKPAAWPGFRGPNRDGVIRGVRIKTDWAASPPVELWRQPVGPGWSSFAVRGNLFYTQEQRGNAEVVACYNLTTGKAVWRHRDTVRFWESNGGAGPRATPAVSNGRVYALGATGILNALDARDGALIWTRNAATDTGAKLPGWGFSGSPVVVGDVVIVAASGRLAGYEVTNGQLRWLGPAHDVSYSSPQLVTIGGTQQILLLSASGATSVAPADGKVLWEHSWPGSAIVQPAVTPDGDILVSTGGSAGGLGTRRLSLAPGAGKWTVEERWTSNGLKPYFNDFVVHKGHAFGFDNNILACIDLQDGKRKWKGGRYGNGQLVLLRDQDALLVLSEEGELALVSATSDQFTEIARFKALEGKTWNHPVVVGDLLLARNGEQMAAFRLPLADR
ncbi:MAG: PQQ-binding-like beta-propeller repeat protein [Acidobacteriota bacterium]